MVQEIIVFRYGHRAYRDERVTSHCCLVARAFGARKIIIQGAVDTAIKKSVDAVVKKWGGEFEVSFCKGWEKKLKELQKKEYVLVHLTMYGLPLKKQEKILQKQKKVCVIIGSQKVEKEIYEYADYNIAITNQPHSEIAALAVCLDCLFAGKEYEKHFSNAKISITPCSKGKKVEKT